MNARDLLRLGYNLGQAEVARRHGFVSDREFKRFHGVWLWSAVRIDDGKRQDKFYARFGSEAFNRRINRVQRVVRKVRGF